MILVQEAVSTSKEHFLKLFIFDSRIVSVIKQYSLKEFSTCPFSVEVPMKKLLQSNCGKFFFTLLPGMTFLHFALWNDLLQAVHSKASQN